MEVMSNNKSKPMSDSYGDIKSNLAHRHSLPKEMVEQTIGGKPLDLIVPGEPRILQEFRRGRNFGRIGLGHHRASSRRVTSSA
jgi:hypothetical protein